MFALYLNPMTANFEVTNCVAVSIVEGRLEQFLIDEACEIYTDEGPDLFNFDGGGKKNYQKGFKKGSILEMYNPIEMGSDACGIFEGPDLDDIHRMHADWLNEDISAWNFRFGQALQL